MPVYRLKDEVKDGKVLPTLNMEFAPGETKEVPATLTDTDFEPVPAPAEEKGGEN